MVSQALSEMGALLSTYSKWLNILVLAKIGRTDSCLSSDSNFCVQPPWASMARHWGSGCGQGNWLVSAVNITTHRLSTVSATIEIVPDYETYKKRLAWMTVGMCDNFCQSIMGNMFLAHPCQMVDGIGDSNKRGMVANLDAVDVSPVTSYILLALLDAVPFILRWKSC